MIAEFPDSTPIGLDIRVEFNTYVGRYLPYTEFNFVNLISWNRHNQGAVSYLNGNLVLRFPSYIGDSQFITFLGYAKPIKTARELLTYAESRSISTKLEFVPGPVATRVQCSKLEIYEDDGDHDYVLVFSKLVKPQDRTLHHFRRAIRTFDRLYGIDTAFVSLDICNPFTQSEMLDVFLRREMSKHGNDWTNEFTALTQLFDYAPHCSLDAYGLRVSGKLQAFMIAELVGKRWSIGQFWKADTTFTGIYSYLMLKIGEDLLRQGVTKMNIQQDLGIESLRFFKLSLGPPKQLKKYKITRRAAGGHEIHDAPTDARSLR